MTKREKVCTVLISIILAIVISLMLALASADAAPGNPLCLSPTPTQPNAVTLVEFSTDSNADFTTGVIVGLALTLVCTGVLVWLRQRGKAEAV